MSKNYDNWEKLVGAVLKKEQLRQLALCNSTSCSTISDDISWFDGDAQNIDTVSVYYDATDKAAIWGMFLSPQEFHPEIISRLVPTEVVFLPIEAREFVIQTEDSPAAQYLHYSTQYDYDSRFETVEINSVSAVDIRGKIRTRLLSSKTIYGVYLLFKLGNNNPPMGMGSLTRKAMKKYNDDERERGRREKAVYRSDGCIEFQIGSFYVDGGDEQEVEARVVETSSRWKGGLMVGGMEFRPLVSVKQL